MHATNGVQHGVLGQHPLSLIGAPLSKIGTHLLASSDSDIMEKNRNSLACLRNAGSYSAQSYRI